jgi:hypothetical protein
MLMEYLYFPLKIKIMWLTCCWIAYHSVNPIKVTHLLCWSRNFCLSWNPKVNYCVPKFQSLDPVLSQLNSVLTLILHFNIYLPFTISSFRNSAAGHIIVAVVFCTYAVTPWVHLHPVAQQTWSSSHLIQWQVKIVISAGMLRIVSAWDEIKASDMGERVVLWDSFQWLIFVVFTRVHLVLLAQCAW